MSRLVVVDTGPVIHLAQADVLSLLEETGNVLIPKTVLEELERGPTDVSGQEFVVEAANREVESAFPQLDPGETAALLLCIERDAVLVTDDLAARNAAREEGIEVHGSIGVVLHGYSRGELAEEGAKRILRDLQQDTTLYLSTPLVAHAIELIESDDAGW